MLNPNGHESALGGKHQHSDVMANHRMEQQNQEYSPLQMGYNPGSMDVTPSQENNMPYIMPPIPLEQAQPSYGEGMGMYYQHPQYQMYESTPAYNANMLPYMPPQMQLLPQYEQFHPVPMPSVVPNYTQRTGYHDLTPVRGGQVQMVGRGGHRKQRNFICC